jgi:hypothetical protein
MLADRTMASDVAGAESGVEGLGEADEILRIDADEASAGTVYVGDEEEGDGEDEGEDEG